jgi:hypothetical protein
MLIPAYKVERDICRLSASEGFWMWKACIKNPSVSSSNDLQKSLTGCLDKERDLGK